MERNGAMKSWIETTNDAERRFNGDTLTLVGSANGDGYRIGFGECVGTILPAHDQK